MMQANMIAPCGLNCTLCTAHLRGDSPCLGCNGPEERKPDFCRTGCAIVHCERRKALADGFCDGCERYPCADVMEKETRYSNAYPMVETPIGNLAAIRRSGMERFLQKEQARWRCPVCGAVICVHDGVCSGCGKRYTNRVPAPVDEGE